MNQNNNGRGIFYGVIGVATLVVAIIGATFAYFTASASNETTINGTAAKISLGVSVTKVTDSDVTKNGMIPMSNSMVEAALTNGTNKDTICVDDNGNSVCQVYKIVLSNTSTAAVMVDGWVALVNGSGVPTDYTSTDAATGARTTIANPTTMRWAQAFCSYTEGDANAFDKDDVSVTKSTLTSCSTATTSLETLLGSTNDLTVNAIGVTTAGETSDTGVGYNKANILDTLAEATTNVTINSSTYAAITKNYIRVSNHAFSNSEGSTGIGNAVTSFSATETYKRSEDITSGLVYNQYIAAGDSKTYHIVVWLGETGADQTVGSQQGTNVATSGISFFNGQVKFVSADGSEVSATFQNYTRTGKTA